MQIAWRYLRRPGDRLVSAGGLVSLLGLVIGVMALVISMALMTGYREDLERKLLGGNAELFLYPRDRVLEDPDGLVATVESVPGVESASPAIFQQALVTSEAHATGEQVMLKGVDVDRRGDLPRMTAAMLGRPGTLTTADGSPGIVLGSHLAKKLGVTPGAALVLTVPTEHAGTFLPRSAAFLVTNVFETGFFEFDSRWLFISLEQARDLLAMGAAANVLEIDVADRADPEEVMVAVGNATSNAFALTDWRQMNRQLFSLLRIQQLVLFIVIGLIVFVSTFNIVSTLIMTIHEKRREIGVLLSMGGERRFIRRIFIWYGTLVGLFGTATGIALGVLVSRVVTRYELLSFGPEIAQVYFVSSIPFITRPAEILWIALFAMTVCWLATLLPSSRAARLAPVEALRWE